MYQRPVFTLQNALDIQAQHVETWKHKLNDQCYVDLVDFILAENKKLTSESDPYSVARGETITNFVSNWKPKENKPLTNDQKTVKIFCASWGMSDQDITVEVLNVDQFIRFPAIGETLSTEKGCYLIDQISHDLKENSLNLWIDEKGSDFYD